MARKKRPLRCKFCGNVGHIVKACKDAEEYVLSGRCMRDASGNILLPSGAKIPRETPGKTLRDRCDVYHQQSSRIPELEGARHEQLPPAADAVASPATQQHVPRQRADTLGTPPLISEPNSEARRRVQDRAEAALPTQAAQRYSQQCKPYTTLAISVHH